MPHLERTLFSKVTITVSTLFHRRMTYVLHNRIHNYASRFSKRCYYYFALLGLRRLANEVRNATWQERRDAYWGNECRFETFSKGKHIC